MKHSAIKIWPYLVSTLAWISGLCVFIPLGLIILGLSPFIHPRHFDGFIKAGCRTAVAFLFIRIKVEGLHLIDKRRTVLFMSNHVNLFDVLILYGHIPGFIRAVELDVHFDWPFYGRIIRRMGMIPISHTNGRSALKSLKIAEQAIAGGTSILILPEGHRTLTGHLSPFMRGSFLLAKEAGVDIVPAVMIGAFAINRKGSLLIRPGKMTLRFGEPIPYENIKNSHTAKIAALVQQKMSALSLG